MEKLKTSILDTLTLPHKFNIMNIFQTLNLLSNKLHLIKIFMRNTQTSA